MEYRCITMMDGTLAAGMYCPYCGDSAHVIGKDDVVFDVTCNGDVDEECRAVIREENFQTGYLDEKWAIAAWNKRV